jgi:hypothetical protein
MSVLDGISYEEMCEWHRREQEKRQRIIEEGLNRALRLKPIKVLGSSEPVSLDDMIETEQSGEPENEPKPTVLPWYDENY